MKSYKDLEIYSSSFKLFFIVHKASLLLPKYELYELGSQIRRAADSVITNIVEGYGRRRYKAEFIRFLDYSYSSALEMVNHLEKIEVLYPDLFIHFSKSKEEYDILGAKIYKFIKYVESNWNNNPTDNK